MGRDRAHTRRDHRRRRCRSSYRAPRTQGAHRGGRRRGPQRQHALRLRDRVALVVGVVRVQGGRANARGTHPRRRTLAEYRIGGRGQGPRDSHKRWTRDGGPVTSMEVTVTFIALPCSAEVSVWVARLSHSARLLAVAGPIVAPGDPMSRTILRRCTTSRTSTRVKESSPASGGTYRKTFCACHSSACALGPNRRSPGTCMRRPAIS